MDEKGVANYVERILEIPEIIAIQWVQSVGNDLPIMLWIPFIRKIHAAVKSVVDVHVCELENLSDIWILKGYCSVLW